MFSSPLIYLTQCQNTKIWHDGHQQLQRSYHFQKMIVQTPENERVNYWLRGKFALIRPFTCFPFPLSENKIWLHLHSYENMFDLHENENASRTQTTKYIN